MRESSAKPLSDPPAGGNMLAKALQAAQRPGHTVFAYVIGGRGVFCDQKDPYTYEAVSDRYVGEKREQLISDQHLVSFTDGDSVTVSAEAEPVRFLLISGRPIREPIPWYGPIVMNTQEELRTAFEELEKGTFINHRVKE